MRDVRRLTWLLAAGVLLTAGYFLMVVRQSPAPSNVIRVGVDHSPPFYVIGDNGSVSGLAFDVLNEAARRRRIQLQWVPLHDIPLDDALRQRRVQLWPLVGPTAERKKNLFLSKPWLQNEYSLLSLQDRPVRNSAEAAGLTIAHARLRTTAHLAHQFLPTSKLTVRIYRADAVAAVCRGEAAAAVLESGALEAILLMRPPGCENAKFHVARLAGAVAPLSIAAVPEMRAAAVSLRDEVTTMAQDGFLGERLDEWLPSGAESTRALWAAEAADRRSSIYRFLLLTIAVFAVGLGWVAHRARRLELAAENAQGLLRETERRFTAFMDNSPAVSFMKDANGRLLYVNKAWSQLFGRSPEQCYGKSDFSLWPPEVAHQIRATDLELLAGSEPRQWIEHVPVTSSDTRAMLTVKFPFASESGERFVGGTAIDITDREAARSQLAASEARYRELFDQNPLPAWVYDRKTLAFLTVNDAAVKKYGWTRADFLSGMRLPDLLTGDDAQSGSASLDSDHAERRAWKHVTKDGLVLSVDLTSYELDYEGHSARLTIVSDVTEQERVLEHLRMSDQRWQLALQGAGDALWDWDLRTGSVFRSPSWRTMLGYRQDEIGDSREDLNRLLHPEDAGALEAALTAHLEKRTPTFTAEYRLRHKNGTWRWILDRGQAVRDERGRAFRMAGSHTDVTERKAVETLLAFEARTDSLTGLSNRREFDRRFTALAADARARSLQICACICDLDRFKEVNDSYGHAAGDRVLAGFGAILREHLRKTDLMARVGGDEFLLAFPRTTSAEAHAIVERIREQLHSLVFRSEAGNFFVSCSFGIAELRDTHLDGTDLLADADRMLYSAKNSGRNRTMAA